MHHAIFLNDLKLTKMNDQDQDQDTPFGHNNHCVKQELPMILHKKNTNQTQLCTFHFSDIELAQKTLGQNHDTSSGKKQSLREV